MNETGESESDNSFENFVSWMEKAMNRATDPTRDFYRYAAGNREECDETYFDRDDLFEYLMENETISVQYPIIEKVRTFYNSYPGDVKDLLRNEHFIEFCGGSPDFNDNWNSESFDWIKALAIFQAMGITTDLRTSVSYSNQNRTFDLMYTGNCVEDTAEAEVILKDAEISAERTHEIINDINVIAEQIKSIPSELMHIRNEATKSLTDLREEAFNYEKYFETWFGQSLTEDDVFLLNPYEYLGRYLNIFSEAQPKTIANYLTFVLFLYNNKHSLQDSTGTWNYFTAVIFSVGFDAFGKETERGKRRIVYDILFASIKELCEEVNYDYNDLEREALSLRFEKEVYEYVDTHFQLEDVEKIYRGLDISPDDFLQNLINVRALEVPAAFKQGLSERCDDYEIYYEALMHLGFFFSHWQKPLVYYFADWNVKNWKTIFSHIAYYCRIENWHAIIELLKKQTKTYNICLYQKDLDYDFYPALIFCMKKSYENYKTWLLKNEVAAKRQDELLQRLNLNSRNVFFVLFMQQHFVMHSDILVYEDNFNEVVDNLVIMNSEDFAKEFNCRTDARMNPKDKCVIKLEECSLPELRGSMLSGDRS